MNFLRCFEFIEIEFELKIELKKDNAVSFFIKPWICYILYSTCLNNRTCDPPSRTWNQLKWTIDLNPLRWFNKFDSQLIKLSSSPTNIRILSYERLRVHMNHIWVNDTNKAVTYLNNSTVVRWCVNSLWWEFGYPISYDSKHILPEHHLLSGALYDSLERACLQVI